MHKSCVIFIMAGQADGLHEMVDSVIDCSNSSSSIFNQEPQESYLRLAIAVRNLLPLRLHGGFNGRQFIMLPICLVVK